MRIVVVFLFIHTFIWSQSSDIHITYRVSYQNEEETFKNVPQLREYFEYTMENDWKIKFELKGDQQGSSFKVKKNIMYDENNHKDRMMLSFLGTLGSIYCLNDSVYTNVGFLGKNIYKKTCKTPNWVFHEETKKIDGYLCYKATNIKMVDSGERVFNHPVVAWFCPELPYQYGPNGYGNLPGLILELQVRNVVFGADKIEFTNIEPIDFSFLEKAKIYTQEEIDKLCIDFNSQ